jgi:hypothetical protein
VLKLGSQEISIVNFSGQVVYQQDLGSIGAGIHEFIIDVDGFSSGVYFFQVLGNNGIVSKKVSIIR